MKKIVMSLMLAATIFSCSEESTPVEVKDDIVATSDTTVGYIDEISMDASPMVMQNVNYAMVSVSNEIYIPDQGGVPTDMVDSLVLPDTTGDVAKVEVYENDFIKTADSTKSTFSIDVDNASYTLARENVTNGFLPSSSSVRIEEFINYFDYAYPTPTGAEPFEVITMVGECPWNASHKLAHVGIQGRVIDFENLPPNNLVFLIDVSGSMSGEREMLKKSFITMVKQSLSAKDYVSLVTYAGNTKVVLQSTQCDEKGKAVIIDALSGLTTGGSTAGAAGITLAYEQAQLNFLEGANNRVLLATDGDFNVGTSSDDELVSLIETKRDGGVFLSILGYGMSGGYMDAKMEKITNAGNGNYFYIDSQDESDKVLGRELFSNINTIAKDVKIQMEFSADRVLEYRLIGYENRVMANNDFDNDAVDAGEIGPGHSVTALYELVMNDAVTTGSIFDVKLRYKEPEGTESILIEKTIESYELGTLENEFNFAASVAQFGLLLKGSKYKADASYEAVRAIAQASLGADLFNDRAGFIVFVDKASAIAAK